MLQLCKPLFSKVIDSVSSALEERILIFFAGSRWVWPPLKKKAKSYVPGFRGNKARRISFKNRDGLRIFVDMIMFLFRASSKNNGCYPFVHASLLSLFLCLTYQTHEYIISWIMTLFSSDTKVCFSSEPLITLGHSPLVYVMDSFLDWEDIRALMEKAEDRVLRVARIGFEKQEFGNNRKIIIRADILKLIIRLK